MRFRSGRTRNGSSGAGNAAETRPFISAASAGPGVGALSPAATEGTADGASSCRRQSETRQRPRPKVRNDAGRPHPLPPERTGISMLRSRKRKDLMKNSCPIASICEDLF